MMLADTDRSNIYVMKNIYFYLSFNMKSIEWETETHQREEDCQQFGGRAAHDDDNISQFVSLMNFSLDDDYDELIFNSQTLQTISTNCFSWW